MTALAFVCAMPMELDPIVEKLGLSAGHDYHEGTVAGRRVVATSTGMGPDLATAGTSQLLDSVDVDQVVVVGITGAVDNETPIGTLVLPELVVDGATGTEHRPDHIASGSPAGTMWTTATLMTDLDEIARLRDRGVVCLDMETAAVAAVCESRGIPWSVFRVISDRATDGSLDEEVFRLSNPDGSADLDAVTKYFAEHPERAAVMEQLAEGALRGASLAAAAAISACGLDSG